MPSFAIYPKQESFSGNAAAADLIAGQRYEESLYYKYKEYYGYVFYIGQKRYGNKRTKDKELSATEVARLCGFSSLSRLSCNFRQYFNVTIREFRSHT